ncbi:MAG: succinate dehydrogenase, cytochrome b556 subunit [Actinomycetota bacterium]|nr:succinate dehydrogenase, cytochrome b556 subunit [Actinomycetota bacterium]
METLDRGMIYRGRLSMWLFIAHRVTGIGVLGFLFLHILDTSFVLLGPEVYDGVSSLYHTFFFRLAEIGLLAALLVHSVNGLRIMALDFWSRGALYEQRLNVAAAALFLISFVPSGIYMFIRFFTVET